MSANDALVKALGRARAPQGRQVSTRLFTVLLLGLFFAALLVALAVGAHVYNKVEDSKQRADEMHVQSGFMANIVRMNDSASAIKRGEGPEGPALVLVEALDTGTYETRLYLSGGQVVQEYAIAGRDYRPADAVPLFASNTFDFSLEGGLLSICTDSGTINVALRSDQGGGA